MLDVLWLIPLFALGAALYASVGHGGATLYLAILVLAGYPRTQVASPVLILNILVASTAFILFRQAGHFRWPLLWPFLLASVPTAYLGGRVHLGGAVQDAVFVFALGLAAVRFLVIPTPPRARFHVQGPAFFAMALVLGGALGFLAGATGIGGGIFLSPLLVFLGWATVKEAGTVAAAFIVLNSASGLAARLPWTGLNAGFVLTLAGAVLIGGALGAHFGAHRVPPAWSQRLLGLVLVVAVVRILINYT